MRDGVPARTAVGAAAAWASSPATRAALADAGGARLGGWLLAAAATDDDDGRGSAAERALRALLADAASAPAVLGAPGARPALLALVAQSSAPDKLAAAAAAGAASAAVDAAAHAASGRVPPRHAAARLDDVRAVAAASTEPGASETVRTLSASFLGGWADAGPVAAGKVAAAGGGAALAASAAAAAADPSASRLRAATVAAMRSLAVSCPLPGRLGAGAWIDPLVLLAADAAATGDDRATADSLDALAAALAAGAPLADADTAPAVAPLLMRLVKAPAAPAVRRAACRALAAAAAAPDARPLLGEDLLDDAADALVARLVEGAPRPPARGGGPPVLLPPTAPSAEEQAAAARALAALCTGPRGRARAAGWLGELLVAATAGARAAGTVKAASDRDTTPHPPGWWARTRAAAGTNAHAAADAAASWLASWRASDTQAAAAAAVDMLAAAAADSDDADGGGDGAVAAAAAAAVVTGSADDADGEDGLAPTRTLARQPPAAAPAADDDAWRQAVAVAPHAARSAAIALRELFGRAATYQEPPADAETVLAPAAAAAYPAAAAAVDAAVADRALAACLHALAELVTPDATKQAWLAQAGVVPLLERLVFDRDRTGGDGDGGPPHPLRTSSPSDSDDVAASLPPLPPDPDDGVSREPPSLAVRRAAARLAAMAAASRAGARALARPRPAAWLAAAATGDDLPLASYAVLTQLAAGRQGAPPAPGAAMLTDGVHVFCPHAPHHTLLAAGPPPPPTSTDDAPLIDVVFVHGLRGGAFATWRTASRGAARGRAAPLGLTPSDVWPAAWLAADVPRARLLSVDYAAPVSGWEGEALPLVGVVSRLARRLAAARVGDRPTVYVCHSLGGVIVKEMLAAGQAPGAPPPLAALAGSAAGVVCYACPHRGSWLARVGWNLRFVGASPTTTVGLLRGGAALDGGDAALRAACESGRVRVLSYGETEKLSVARVLPPLLVVPPESAAPGYGEFVALEGADHIRVCKPAEKGEVAYQKTAALVMEVVAEATRAAGVE